VLGFRTYARRGATIAEVAEPRPSTDVALLMASGEIINGLGDRNMRSALMIAEGMKTLLERIEEAPPEVLEALLEHARAVQRSGGMPVHRFRLRKEIIAYIEGALAVAQDRERHS
jgi:hypothetical protein